MERLVIPRIELERFARDSEAIMSLTNLNVPSVRLLLGSDALQYANYKIQMLQAGIEANKETTLLTDFK
jgi:hypothetical protein